MTIQHFEENFEAHAPGTVLTTSNTLFTEISAYTGGPPGQTQVIVAPGSRKAMANVPWETLPDPSTTYDHHVSSGSYVRRDFSPTLDPDWYSFTAAEADFYVRHDNLDTFAAGVNLLTLASWGGVDLRIEKNLRDQYGNFNPPPYTWQLVLLAGFDFHYPGLEIPLETWFNLRVETPDIITPGAPAYVYFNGSLLFTLPSPWPDDPTRWTSATWQTYTIEGFVHESFGDWASSPVVWDNTTLYIDNAKWSIQEKEPVVVEPEPLPTSIWAGPPTTSRRFEP